MSKELKWGERPWEQLSHEELLRCCDRMYIALLAAKSALSLCEDGSPFWSKQGTGGRALAQVLYAVEKAQAGYESGEIYGCYTRYADDLLFPRSYGGRFGWVVCDKCGEMHGIGERETSTCFTCKVEMRPLKWSDLEKAK